KFKEMQKADGTDAVSRPATENVSAPSVQTGSELNALLSESLRKPHAGEIRLQGTLISIECNSKGITFHVKSGDRLLNVHTDRFEHMTITAFTREVSGEITCGKRKPENPVVVTYVAAKENRTADGEITALEFVHKDFLV